MTCNNSVPKVNWLINNNIGLVSNPLSFFVLEHKNYWQ